MEQKKSFAKGPLRFFLTLLLAFLPAGSMISGNFAHAAEFKIQMLQKGSMLADYNFYFFNVRVGTGIFYWIKSDGSPLFCVQKEPAAFSGLGGAEDSEEFGSWKHFSDQQYELVSLVLQSCGQRRGESRELKPGEYLAGPGSGVGDSYGILGKHGSAEVGNGSAV